jgi:hypothetical protein
MVRAMTEREFTCVDCGIRVVQLIQSHANDQDLCAVCTFLRTIEDPKERADVRKFLDRNH